MKRVRPREKMTEKMAQWLYKASVGDMLKAKREKRCVGM